MKLAVEAQNPLEWLALKAGLVPRPLAYAHFGFMMSKFVLEAVDKGVFDAIGRGEVTLQHLATTLTLNERALGNLLGVLVSLNLVRFNSDRYTLTPQAKKWVIKDSPQSLYWLMMFDNRVCLKWMDYTGSFLKTGVGLEYHSTLTDEEWFYYQKAMEAAAAVTSKEAVHKIPVSPSAKHLLDIGGAHGLYSVALCKKHPGLHATILDLPAAVNKAKDILATYNMADRIKHLAGDALNDDLGIEQYDNVLLASVAHHFTAEQNRALAAKVYRALKPGGYFTILEVIRQPVSKSNTDMLSAMGNFFFALSSTSGLWSLNEIKDWQQEAGLKFYRKRTFLTIPGYTAITAQKPIGG